MSHSDSKHGPDCHSCGGHQAVPSVSQTLDEMEFERGIWSAALNDDVDGVVRQLDKGIDVNTTDSAGYTALVGWSTFLPNRSIVMTGICSNSRFHFIILSTRLLSHLTPLKTKVL